VKSTDEEIVAGDPGLVVERRPVRLYSYGQRLPLILCLLIQRPPGLQCPAMNTQGCRLTLRVWKNTPRTLSEAALPVLMVGRNLPCGPVQVSKKDGGIKVVHRFGSLKLIGSCQVPQRLHKGKKYQAFNKRSTHEEMPLMMIHHSGGGAAAAPW
jgi:hypothetical protein